MIYTVGEMAKMLSVAPSTLRYYDKEGLLPFLERSGGGMRMFKDADFEWLFIIDCLKKAGMPIKDIRDFIEMVMKGDETIGDRLELFNKQRKAVEEKISQLQATLDTLNYKCWYYETAKKAGTTAVPREMNMEEVPEQMRHVKEMLQKAHSI
ncbi:MAG: MerR family transcriptional regulator [Firmicutes bacterium HGW-Firmicutes-15]|nr:MAG: MerR family transcriptional regulator [Firmicutes bacterium HGW-Firmicutes-15]